MRLLSKSAVLLSISAAFPALSQNRLLASSTPGSVVAPVSSAESTSASVPAPTPIDLTDFRNNIAEKNRSLAMQVSAEKAIVKKNGQMLQNAKKIDAANKKLEAQHRRLEEANAAIDKQREALETSDKPVGSGADGSRASDY